MATSLITGAKSASKAYKPPKIKIPGLGSQLASQGFAGQAAASSGGAPPSPYSYPTNPTMAGLWANPFSYGAPDYSALIGGDWETQFAEGNKAAALARAKAQYRQSLNQALIDLGVTDLGQLGEFGQYVDADTIAKAASNKYSTMAQIANQQRKSTTQSSASLAARGILSSGQNVENRENIIEGAESARYGAMREFLSGAEQGLTGLGDLEFQLDQEIAKARGAAGQRAAETYPFGYPEPGDDIFGKIDLSGGAYGKALKAAGAKPKPKPKKKTKKNVPGQPGFRPF